DPKTGAPSGGYTNFGQVVSGQDVVDKMQIGNIIYTIKVTDMPPPTLALNTPATEATNTSEPIPTPQELAIKAEYVQVVNTGGTGVRLRSDPKPNANGVRILPEGKIVQIIGPDQTNIDGTWTYVRTLDENGDTGWIARNYLVPAPPP
ncbi:MAG: hypothetical protein DLM69_05375, partial [Candidatus Chloroheliales bacterium]